MAAVRGDAERHIHLVEEGRIGQIDPHSAEIVGHCEAQLIASPRQPLRREIGAAAVGIGHATRDLAVGAAERHDHAGGRAAVHGVEDMGGEAGHAMVSRRSRTISPIWWSASAISALRSLPRRRSIAARMPALSVSRTQMMKGKPKRSR